ncbi:hypothetical protein PNOK_0829600 [Pyrrhoderma noxium]|uniref:DUF6533 domain-containing protein n=1 Tax=Pyrrhoderma noxium TaxID=2282107 RepID=A0A286UAV4_9AGAM|nr:hypothetical protein PNOK_0829600 [Pyrrhoderma noxium]
MMISPSSQPVSEEIIKDVYFTQLVIHTNLSSLVLYLYYYVTTLDSEISVMWTARFGIGKFLFYSISYSAHRHILNLRAKAQ